MLSHLYREYDDSPNFVEMTKTIFGIPLMGGECFYWSKPICDLVSSASQSMPSSWALLTESLPVPCGFFWLAKPIVHKASPLSIRAISWVPVVLPRDEDKERGVMIIGHPLDPRDKWKGVSLLGRPSTNLGELRASEDRIGITFFLDDQQTFPMPAPLTVLLWPIGASLERPGQRLDGDILHNPERAEGKMKLFASMLAFLEQKILVPFRQRPDRGARRRAEKVNRQDTIINVVKLREIARPRPRESSAPVKWTCQWLVRGHWRNQWYPRRQFYQMHWIVPYIKGPKDKPLREPRHFFVVVR